MKIIALATLLAFTGAPTGAHHLVGSEFGPAKYGDRCSLDSEIIGHPVPPFSDDAYGITNEYPIGLNGDPHRLLIGYVYTTEGGIAYFVPSARAYQLHVTTVSDSASLRVGQNSLVEGAANLAPPVRKVINTLVKGTRAPAFLNHGRSSPACFSRNWNGHIHN